jgi:hypothetical protein
VAAVVIADASPLIGLARVNGLRWLQALFQEVFVTDVVIGEVLTGTFPDSEARIQAALNIGWLKVVNSTAEEPHQTPPQECPSVGAMSRDGWKPYTLTISTELLEAGTARSSLARPSR